MNPPHMPYGLVPENTNYCMMKYILIRWFIGNIPKKDKVGLLSQILKLLCHDLDIDDQLGRIMATLKSTGLEENTIVLLHQIMVTVSVYTIRSQKIIIMKNP